MGKPFRVFLLGFPRQRMDVITPTALVVSPLAFGPSMGRELQLLGQGLLLLPAGNGHPLSLRAPIVGATRGCAVPSWRCNQRLKQVSGTTYTPRVSQQHTTKGGVSTRAHAITTCANVFHPLRSPCLRKVPPGSHSSPESDTIKRNLPTAVS